MIQNDLTTRQALTRDALTRDALTRDATLGQSRLALLLDLPTCFAGALSPAGDAAPIAFRLTRGTSDGEVWMRFEAEGTGPVPVRLLEASGPAVVALVGPYRDPATGVSLHTLLEGRISAHRILGTFRTLRADRANTVLGAFSASAADCAAA